MSDDPNPSPALAETLNVRSGRFFTRRRVFLAIAATLLFAFVLLWLESIDDAAPDVSDLVPSRRELPDRQNAFLVLERVAALVPLRHNDKTGGEEYRP